MVVRPASITAVVVLTWISGLLDVLGGVILLFQSGDETRITAFGSSGGLLTSAVISIIFGTAVIIVVSALFRGNAAARALVTVFQLLSIAGSLYLAFALPANAVIEWVSIALVVTSLLLLWSRKANTYFRR